MAIRMGTSATAIPTIMRGVVRRRTVIGGPFLGRVQPVNRVGTMMRCGPMSPRCPCCGPAVISVPTCTPRYCRTVSTERQMHRHPQFATWANGGIDLVLVHHSTQATGSSSFDSATDPCCTGALRLTTEGSAGGGPPQGPVVVGLAGACGDMVRRRSGRQ
jgi:hypothetical protein